jgi:uncharacterized protein YndB with AHSA1/START domain
MWTVNGFRLFRDFNSDTEGSMNHLNVNPDDKGLSIYHSLIIDADLAKVFRSVSEPEHLVNWWPDRCVGIPKLGNTYGFYFGPEYNWRGKVSEFVPNKAFYVKMTDADEDWVPTTFGFDISTLDDKVQLDFWHKGWPSCNAHFKRSSFCWAILLKGLKDYIEAGIVIPFADRG